MFIFPNCISVFSIKKARTFQTIRIIFIKLTPGYSLDKMGSYLLDSYNEVDHLRLVYFFFSLIHSNDIFVRALHYELVIVQVRRYRRHYVF